MTLDLIKLIPILYITNGNNNQNRECIMFRNEKCWPHVKNVQLEKSDEAEKRGVKVEVCPAIPSKRQRETERSYKKRVRAAKKIDLDALPEDIKKIVVDKIYGQ